jgi:4-hydroxybenzoate polyprenyltransferase
MSVPILGRLIDERFFAHRKRSTSLAGIVSGVFAGLLFAYRYYVQGRKNWDLAAVLVLFVIVKMAAMIFFYSRD